VALPDRVLPFTWQRGRKHSAAAQPPLQRAPAAGAVAGAVPQRRAHRSPQPAPACTQRRARHSPAYTSFSTCFRMLGDSRKRCTSSADAPCGGGAWRAAACMTERGVTASDSHTVKHSRSRRAGSTLQPLGRGALWQAGRQPHREAQPLPPRGQTPAAAGSLSSVRRAQPALAEGGAQAQWSPTGAACAATRTGPCAPPVALCRWDGAGARGTGAAARHPPPASPAGARGGGGQGQWEGQRLPAAPRPSRALHGLGSDRLEGIERPLPTGVLPGLT